MHIEDFTANKRKETRRLVANDFGDGRIKEFQCNYYQKFGPAMTGRTEATGGCM